MLEAGPKPRQPPCLPACHPSLPPRFDLRCLLRPARPRPVWPGAGGQWAPLRCAPPALPPAFGESIVVPRPNRPFVPLSSPRSPLLATCPYPLTPFVASAAQDLDDFYDERGWRLGLWLGQSAPGAGVGLASIYVKTC